MNGKFVLAWLLLLAAPVMVAHAQDGDLISDVGGSNDGEEDDGGWSCEPPCSDPDTRPPVIFADRKLTNITVQCFKDVPGVPSVWAIDKCDGNCDVETNLPDRVELVRPSFIEPGRRRTQRAIPKRDPKR